MADEVRFNTLEIIVFCIGVILTLSLLGYLSYEVVAVEDGHPPQLEVTSRYDPDLSDYTYHVTVRNNGEETATSVAVKMTLYQKGKAKETGIFNIDYIPVHSEEKGLVTFDVKKQPADSLVVSSITLVRP